jgi:hypothetical protein
MLRGFPVANEDHRDIQTITQFQDRIVIYINFPEDGVELAQEWRDGGFGLLAEVASGPGVESNDAGAGGGDAGVFGMGAHRFALNLHLTGERARLGRTGA